jgi:hypothetical protein
MHLINHGDQPSLCYVIDDFTGADDGDVFLIKPDAVNEQPSDAID